MGWILWLKGNKKLDISMGLSVLLHGSAGV